MSTADFATHREKIGKQPFEYNGSIVVDYDENPFRGFRVEGDEDFKKDAFKAPFAPAWKAFREAVNSGSYFAIITARGHEPKTLKRAVRALIEAERKGIRKQAVMRSVQKYRDLAAMGTGEGEDIIEQYLDMCRFHPVSFSGARS